MQNGEITVADRVQYHSILRQKCVDALAVGGIVFAAALFGILTRSSNHLAVFWIANALLVGVFVRRPDWASVWGWTAALIGYLTADLVTGASWNKSILLTAANLAGCITGYVLFSFLDEADRRLSRPMSVFYMCVIVAAASTMSGIFGGFANPILFDAPAIDGFYFWLLADTVNYVAILPVIMTMPGLSRRKLQDKLDVRGFFSRGEFLPLVALIISCLMGMLLGGPGALAFPVPALLWCAVSFSLFPVTILSFLFTAWVLMSMHAGFFPHPSTWRAAAPCCHCVSG